MKSTPLFQPEFSGPTQSSPFVSNLGSEARDRFRQVGFPSRNDEDWRLTSLAPVTDVAFTKAPAAAIDLDRWTLPDTATVTFVNDRLVDASGVNELAPGVLVSPLRSACTTHPEIVEQYLGTLASIGDQPFVALNTAQNLEGALIHLGPGAKLEQPLNIVYAATGKDIVTYPRTLIIAEDGAQATIVETFVSDGRTLMCPVTEVAVKPGASLRHSRLFELGPDGSCVGSLSATVETQASYRLNSASLEGSLVRSDIHVKLNGELADAVLDGLTLVDGSKQGVTHVVVEHNVPNCTSTQRFRSVLDDRSKTVFTGRIIVAEDAQKTDARQSSRSLLRSTNAVAHNNPQLEIYADDVRCTHGSTVGQLDQEALFYLRTRGIGLPVAQGLLTLAFAAEVLDSMPVQSIKSRLEELLMAKLGPAAVQ